MLKSDNNSSIVMYHYIRGNEKNKYNKLKFLDAKKFENQINYFLKYFKIENPKIIKNKIIKNEKLGKDTIWLTFDDGYKDHVEYVLPLLTKYNIKASFFPVIESSFNNKVLDVNKVQFLLAVVDNKNQLFLEIKKLYLYMSDSSKKEEDFNLLINNLKANRLDELIIVKIKCLLQYLLPKKIREKICNLLFKKYVSKDEKEFSADLYMNENDIKKLIIDGHDIGYHGYTHQHLDALSKGDQKKEILNGVKFLQNKNYLPDNWVMCYPSGNYNNLTIEIIKQYGCIAGLTTVPEKIDINNYKKYELPRLDTLDYPSELEL